MPHPHSSLWTDSPAGNAQRSNPTRSPVTRTPKAQCIRARFLVLRAGQGREEQQMEPHLGLEKVRNIQECLSRDFKDSRHGMEARANISRKDSFRDSGPKQSCFSGQPKSVAEFGEGTICPVQPRPWSPAEPLCFNDCKH